MVKTVPFDPADVLDTPEAIAAYLEDAFAEGDPAQIAAALGVVARAKGLSGLARETGLTRVGLQKALSVNGDPRLTTLSKVLVALGLRLSIQAAT